MYAFTGPQISAREDRVPGLQEEIAMLERRIDLMGTDGDWACERAISKIYLGYGGEKNNNLPIFAHPGQDKTSAKPVAGLAVTIVLNIAGVEFPSSAACLVDRPVLRHAPGFNLQ